MPTNNVKLLMKKYSFKLILLALGIAILFFSFLLVRNIRAVNRSGMISQHRSLNELLLGRQKNQTISVSDVNYIDYWMTFKYINTIFKLPENYLKDRLSILSDRYPNVSLGKYASTNKIDRALFVSEVKKTVNSYLETVINQK